jgi:hypothetical protein
LFLVALSIETNNGHSLAHRNCYDASFADPQAIYSQSGDICHDLILNNRSIVVSTLAETTTLVGVFDSASLQSALINVTGGSKLNVNAGLDLNTRCFFFFLVTAIMGAHTHIPHIEDSKRGLTYFSLKFNFSEWRQLFFRVHSRQFFGRIQRYFCNGNIA